VALLGAALMVASGGSLVQQVGLHAGDPAAAQAAACLALAPPWPSSNGCAMVGGRTANPSDGGI